MQKKPLVSICCLAYNHAPYIRQCIEGFLIQKTNFSFEVLIHDDASTDETADIIREYEKKYPEIIFPIYQTVNQFSQGIKVSAVYNFSRAKGKFIAMCEGDDFWTDPLKLQKQIDFLETHVDYVICSHKYQYFFQKEKRFGKIMPEKIKSSFSFDLDYFIHRNIWVTQTLTCVFLRSALDISHYKMYDHAKDLSMFYYILHSGKGYFMNENMGVYRKHEGGVWSGGNSLQMRVSDLKTIKGICDLDNSEASCIMMKTYVELYVNPRDYIFHFSLFWPFLNIVRKKYGEFSLFSLIVRQFVKSIFLHLKIVTSLINKK